MLKKSLGKALIRRIEKLRGQNRKRRISEMPWGIHQLSQPQLWIKHRLRKLRKSLSREIILIKGWLKILLMLVRLSWKTSPNQKIKCSLKRIIAGKVRLIWARYRHSLLQKHQFSTRLQACTAWAIILSKLSVNPWRNQVVLKRPNRRIKFRKSRTKEDRLLEIQMIELPSLKEEVKGPRLKLVWETLLRLQLKAENLAIVSQEKISIWARFRRRVRLKKAGRIMWINLPIKRVHWT